MLRLSGFVSILLAVLCGTLLFWTSQSVQKVEVEVSQSFSRVENEAESYRILTAEWDYLNRPERLEYLTTNGLDIDGHFVDESKILTKSSQIPEPIIPVLPKIKPATPLVYISTQTSGRPKSVKKSVIKKTDSQSFDGLLNDVMAGGE